MYRILIAVKRGKEDHENLYKWYSKPAEGTDRIEVVQFSSPKEAYDAVKELLKNPCPYKDYSYHDLVVVDYQNYDVDIISV